METKSQVSMSYWEFIKKILIVILITVIVVSTVVYLLAVYKHDFYCETPSDIEFEHSVSNVRDFQLSYKCVFGLLFKDRVINKTIRLRIIDQNLTQSKVEFYEP